MTNDSINPKRPISILSIWERCEDVLFRHLYVRCWDSSMDDSLVYEEDGLPTKGDGGAGAGTQSKKHRIFDDKMRNQCWQKADVVPGRHPERWRKDVAGNVVCRRLTRCEGCLCYEYDHIRPFSKGLASSPRVFFPFSLLLRGCSTCSYGITMHRWRNNSQ